MPILSALGFGKTKQQTIHDLILKVDELEHTLETISDTETTHGKKNIVKPKMTIEEKAKVQAKLEAVVSELQKMFAKYPQAFAEVISEFLISSEHMIFLQKEKNILDINICMQIIKLASNHHSGFNYEPELLKGFATLMPIVFNPALTAGPISTEQLKQDMKAALQQSMQGFEIARSLQTLLIKKENAKTKKQKSDARAGIGDLSSFLDLGQRMKAGQVAEIPKKYNDYIEAINAFKTAGTTGQRIIALQKVVDIEKEMLVICDKAIEWLTTNKDDTPFRADAVQQAFGKLTAKLTKFKESLSEPLSKVILKDLKTLKENEDADAAARNTSSRPKNRRG